MTKCSSKARKKSESVNRTRHESSDDENSSDQETALSISNRNERSESDSSSSDGEEDDRKRDFGGQSLETESRGSVQNGNPSGGQSPKLDEKDRDKDGYNHFLYDIKVPVDDEGDEDNDGAQAGSQNKSKYGFKKPSWFKRS